MLNIILVMFLNIFYKEHKLIAFFYPFLIERTYRPNHRLLLNYRLIDYSVKHDYRYRLLSDISVRL